MIFVAEDLLNISALKENSWSFSVVFNENLAFYISITIKVRKPELKSSNGSKHFHIRKIDREAKRAEERAKEPENLRVWWCWRWPLWFQTETQTHLHNRRAPERMQSNQTRAHARREACRRPHPTSPSFVCHHGAHYFKEYLWNAVSWTGSLHKHLRARQHTAVCRHTLTHTWPQQAAWVLDSCHTHSDCWLGLLWVTSPPHTAL